MKTMSYIQESDVQVRNCSSVQCIIMASQQYARDLVNGGLKCAMLVYLHRRVEKVKKFIKLRIVPCPVAEVVCHLQLHHSLSVI